jgi:hypothetical protein
VAAAEANVPAEEETLSVVEERPAQEPAAEPAAAPNDIQVPTWNLDERIPIAPQVWDADTPQIGVRGAEDDVEIVILEVSGITPVEPEPPRRSPKVKRKKRRKRAA